MNRATLLAQLRETPIAGRIITALDVPDIAAAEVLNGRLGPQARWVKVGMELFTAAGPRVVDDLHEAGREIFLDLKYMDIPNTVAGAVRSACALDIGMLTLHASGGRRMLEAAVDAAQASPAHGGRRPALLAVTVLTSFTLAELDEVAPGGGAMSERIVRMARTALESGCDGIVCSPADLSAVRAELGAEILAVTPGVRPASTSGGDDQRRVATPAEAMADGADFLVVGRPVTQAANPTAALAGIVKELNQQ